VHQPEDIKTAILGLPGRTLAAKLRQLMSDIDRRVREGVGHEEIVETLNRHGIEVKLETFRKYLYRYRKKAKSTEAALAPTEKQGAITRPTTAPVTVGKPDISPAPPISNKGDLAKARAVDFDLEQLAQAAKDKE